MPIESLPNEVLVQILDDQELEIHDLAILARVSCRWHDLVVPALYQSCTFRFKPMLEPVEERKIQSFMKHSTYVRSLNVHIVRWSDVKAAPSLDSYISVGSHPGLSKYLEIVDCFTQVTTVTQCVFDYDEMTWSQFWIILNHLLVQKPRMESLTVRKRHAPNFDPSAEQLLDHEADFLPTVPLPNLRHFNLSIGAWTNHNCLIPFSLFRSNIVNAIGSSCFNVAKLSLCLKIRWDHKPEDLSVTQPTPTTRLSISQLNELQYETDELILPSRLISSEFSSLKTLTISSQVLEMWWDCALKKFRLCGEQKSNPDIFRNIESLTLTDQKRELQDDGMNAAVQRTLSCFPSLSLLVLGSDGSQYAISRNLSQEPLYREIT